MTGAKIQRSTKAPGFSVVEMLVVLFLFSVTLLILTQTYLSFIRLSHRTGNAAIVQQDMRFMLEYTARNLRTTPLDYPTPPLALDSVSSTLRLKAAGQSAWIITKSVLGDVRCSDAADVACLLVSSDGGATWTPITSKHVNVETFKVYLMPSVSPFVLQGSDYNSDQQPFVTIQAKLTYMASNAREKVSLTTQTTISSRVYVR